MIPLPLFEDLVPPRVSRRERETRLVLPPFSPRYPRVCGRFSCLLISDNVLEIDERNYVIDLETSELTSPARLARRIARRAIREARVRRAAPDVEERLLALRLPHWAAAGVYDGEWARVDVARAFENILLSWGVREVAPLRWFSTTPIWMPAGRWMGPGEKHVLRVLPSVCAAQRVRVELRAGEFEDIIRRPLDARAWGTVVVVLSAVAEVARQQGAIYWNVDGGIIPARSVSTLRAFCEELGLRIRIDNYAERVDIRAQYAYALYRSSRRVYATLHYARVHRSLERALSDQEIDFMRWALDKVEKSSKIRAEHLT